MNKDNAVFKRLLGIVVAAAVPMTASAISITFEASDLVDVTSGQNLFHGSLTVSDHVFDANQGFTVYFPAELYSSFTEALTANPDWDILAVDPNPAFDPPTPGLYDALALVALAPTAAPFEFDFVFSGAGTPEGVFDFEVYNFDPFEVTDSGQTTSLTPPVTVPEGLATGWALSLAACGLFGLAKIRRRN